MLDKSNQPLFCGFPLFSTRQYQDDFWHSLLEMFGLYAVEDRLNIQKGTTRELRYGMGRKLPGKLLGFLSYFGEVMNAAGDSKNQESAVNTEV